jgi:hypothetical protein
MTSARIGLFLVGLLGAVFLSPWIPALAILLLALRFRAWEAVVLGLCVDMLWLAPNSGFHGLPLFTIAAITVVWGLEPLRSQFLTS